MDVFFEHVNKNALPMPLPPPPSSGRHGARRSCKRFAAKREVAELVCEAIWSLNWMDGGGVAPQVLPEWECRSRAQDRVIRMLYVRARRLLARASPSARRAGSADALP